MKNDTAITAKAKVLEEKVRGFNEYVASLNPCAYSDRMLEDVISTAKEQETLYNSNSPEAEPETGSDSTATEVDDEKQSWFIFAYDSDDSLVYYEHFIATRNEATARLSELIRSTAKDNAMWLEQDEDIDNRDGSVEAFWSDARILHGFLQYSGHNTEFYAVPVSGLIDGVMRA